MRTVTQIIKSIEILKIRQLKNCDYKRNKIDMMM